MLEFDFTFPHSYEVNEFDSLPGSGQGGPPVFYIPRPLGRPEHDGLWLTISPEGSKPWTGVFAFSYSPNEGISRVVSSPDPARACVIAKGSAYFVTADAPEDSEQVRTMPVTDCRVVADAKLLILADVVRLAAYGANGILWESPRVCWDGLRITSIEGGVIRGVGIDPINATPRQMPIAVDLRFGRSLLPLPRALKV